MTAQELVNIIVQYYADQPDDYVISIGHWVNDSTNPSSHNFYSDIKLTVSDLKKMEVKNGT
jgi:hypothetical protein